MAESLYEKAGKILDGMLDMGRHYTDEEFRLLAEEAVLQAAGEGYMETARKRKAAERIFNARRRLDILQPLLDDMNVDEIMVNGRDRIYTERQGRLQEAPIAFDSEERLRDTIQFIVSRINRSVNEASPLVDARLPDGSRIHVALPPVALDGPVLTIRKFRARAYTMTGLTDAGFLSAEAARYLEDAVACRRNIFISGGAGTGKTTFLNVLASYIPAGERIITIEDAAELNIRGRRNLVRLEARQALASGTEPVTIRDLLRAALRMRPDRIIVGEIRGAEALDMLQAMNTGHEGSLSTGHANSTTDMLYRMETMAMYAGLLPLEAIRRQIASAMDILVHLARMPDASRKILEITEVKGLADGEIQTSPIFRLTGGQLVRIPSGEADHQG